MTGARPATTASHWLIAVAPSDVKAGWIALVVIAGLCLATFLLWRSMNHQLRKVRFDSSDEDETRESGDAPTDSHDGPTDSGDQPPTRQADRTDRPPTTGR